MDDKDLCINVSEDLHHPVVDYNEEKQNESDVIMLAENKEEINVPLVDTNEPSSTFARIENSRDSKPDANKKEEIIDNEEREKCYECPVCGDAFKRKVKLKTHLLAHNNKKIEKLSFECSSCGIVLSRKLDFQKHITTHSSKKMLKCSVCKKKFHNKNALKSHMHLHPNNEKCFICGEIFKFRRGFLSHYRTHEVNESIVPIENEETLSNYPIMCFYCDKIFAGTNYQIFYKRHMLTHDGELPYRCLLCPARFSCKKDLLSHRSDHDYCAVHNPKEVFRCEHCGRVFKTKRPFKRHVCWSKKQLSCEVCGRKFQRDDDLNSHMVIHDIRLFHCPSCQKTFIHENYVNIHLLSYNGDEVILCHVCKKESNVKEVMQHKVSRYGKFPKMQQFLYLSSKWRNGENLQTFQNVEKDVCSMCGTSCVETFSFLNNLSSCFQCFKCHKAFKTIDNLYIHLLCFGGERLLSCLVCKSIFHGEKELQRHLENVSRERTHKLFFNELKQKKEKKMGNKIIKISGERTQDPANNQESNAKFHMVTRTGKNSLKCSVCGKKVPLSLDLQDHVKSDNEDESIDVSKPGEDYVYISRLTHSHVKPRMMASSYCTCLHKIRGLLPSSQESVGEDMTGHHISLLASTAESVVPCRANIKVKHNTEVCNINGIKVEVTRDDEEIFSINGFKVGVKNGADVLCSGNGIKVEAPANEEIVKEEWDSSCEADLDDY